MRQVGASAGTVTALPRKIGWHQNQKKYVLSAGCCCFRLVNQLASTIDLVSCRTIRNNWHWGLALGLRSSRRIFWFKWLFRVWLFLGAQIGLACFLIQFECIRNFEKLVELNCSRLFGNSCFSYYVRNGSFLWCESCHENFRSVYSVINVDYTPKRGNC